MTFMIREGFQINIPSTQRPEAWEIPYLGAVKLPRDLSSMPSKPQAMLKAQAGIHSGPEEEMYLFQGRHKVSTGASGLDVSCLGITTWIIYFSAHERPAILMFPLSVVGI